MPLPDFSTLQPVGSSPLPDFGSLKPVEDAAQPPAANSLQLSTSQTPSTPEALAHQNIQGNQKFFNDMAAKTGVTPDEYQQRVFQEAQANQDAALDPDNPRNSKTPLGAFGVSMLRSAAKFPTQPAIDYQIPSNDNDSRVVAAGKEIANKIISIPEFLTSGEGLASIPLGGAAPKALASLFSADALVNAGKTVYQKYPNWDKLSQKEKDAAMIDVASDVAGGLGLANHAAESAGIRTRIPFTESTPTRNAKDLAFQIDKASVNRSRLSNLPQSMPDFPLTNPDAPQPDSAHGSPLVKNPDGVVQPDTAPRPDAFGSSTPVPPGFPTGQMTPTGKVIRRGLPPQLVSEEAVKSVTPMIKGLEKKLGQTPTKNEVIDNLFPNQKDHKYPSGRSFGDVVSHWLGEIYPQRKWEVPTQSGAAGESVPAHTDLPPAASGTVRIFNGSKTAAGTSFYTAKPDEARGYGPYTQYVDIPKKLHESLLADAAAGKTSQPATPGSVELPEAWQKQAKPVSIAQKEAPDITDADKPDQSKNSGIEKISEQELLQHNLNRLPPEIRKDVGNLKLKKDVEFPTMLEGSGALYKNGRILLEAGEPLDHDTILHEILHDYVRKHPELVNENEWSGEEKAVNRLHSQILESEKGGAKPVEPKNASDLVNMSPEGAAAWFKTVKGTTIGEAESRSKAARAKLTAGMTDQQVLDAAKQVDFQNEQFKQNPTAENLTKLGANSHKGQFLREALHDRGYSREYESGKTLEEQIDAKTSGGTTGIAHRVSEARGVAAERGQGASPAAQVEHGRQLLAGGADPEKILSNFQADPRKATSSDGFSILRARQEQLAKAADRAVDEHGASSPQAIAAAKADSDWIEKIKPYQTEWAKQGTAQQGETDLDTGSFTALRRSFESEAKKPMTPKQSRDLKKIAGDNKKAIDEVDAAIKAVTESVDKPPITERVKSITQKVYDALDEQAKAALQRLNSRRAKVGSNLAPQDLADYAILGAAQIAKGIIKFPDWSKSMIEQFGGLLKPDDLEKVYDLAKQKHLDEIRNNFGEFKSGKAFTPDQVKTLWKYAKDNYITGGEVNFSKIRNNLSNDFGLSKPDVARALTQNSTTRNLLDNAYTKQYRARQLRQYAKTWIKREATPSLVRKVQAIPRGLFNLAVFGHGTTWIGTHAGQNLYDPTQWGSLGRNYAKMWKVAYSPVEYEKEAQDLVARPNWETARRAGVNNDPYTRQGDYDTPELTKWAKTMGIGHRGALGLMTLRQDYFDTVWDNLPATDKNREMAKYVADLTNHATGTTRMKMVENPWTNLLLFAPRLVASRFQWVIADPARAALIKGFGLLGKKPTAQEAMFANHVIKKRAIFVATLLSALGLNQIVLNATGSKQKINLTRPHESDWLRFKGLGMEVAPFSAGVAVARLMAQEYSDFFVNHKHRGGLPFNPAEQAGTDALRYGRSELSPVASHILDLAAQSDYSGRPLPAIPGRNPPPDEPAYLKREGVKPYTWTQYAFTAAPIPAEGAIQEAFQTQGMNESAAKKYTKLIVSAAAMALTGVLVKEDPKSK